MTTVPHQIIRASAGSGKTYQLTLRFIRLLALGAAPDHIVALTFTRKAAGEFFARILARLAEASDDEAQARSLAAAIHCPHLASADFRRLLRAVVAGMHRLRLGTLDSFFAQILRCYPYEFGLSGDFSVPTAEMARIERQRVLARLFEPGEELSEAQREFFEAFKQATWGEDEFRLSRQLDTFIESRHSWFLGAPFAGQWGGEKIIWPNGFPCPSLTPDGLAAALVPVRETIERTPMTEKQRGRWTSLLEALADLPPRPFHDKRLRYFLDRLPGWPGDGGLAPVELSVDRKSVVFPAEAWRAFRSLLLHIVGLELKTACLRSAGVWRLLSHYEAAYHRVARSMGKLSFADVQALLAGATPEQRRTSGDGSPLARIGLAFRLDGKFDHWLLDEFQDTSLLQWRIVQPLVDEVLQDDSGRRTYFHVGDAKQAIYAWREGESRLTDLILDRYGGGVEVRALDVSHRSAPAVLEAVNRICGANAIHQLFPEASDRWFRLWTPHRPAEKNAALTGHAALIRPPQPAAEGEDSLHSEMRAIALLLNRIQPLARGLTCAILVEKNDDVRSAARLIQELTGLPATSEARQRPAADNLPSRALLALLHAAAHPGDTLAWQAVLMSPLRGLCSPTPQEATRLRAEVLLTLHEGGFSRCLEHWAAKLRRLAPPLDAFNSQRLERLIDLGARYDAEGGTDIDEFLAFAHGVEIRTEATPRAIQCMTIHASKGLEYDVVFLPALSDDSYQTLRSDWLMQRAHTLEPEWFLRCGSKQLALSDATLGRAHAAMTGEQVYEALCATYVAVTRARRALYLIGAVPGEASKSGTTDRKNTAVWVEHALVDSPPTALEADGQTLGVAWQTGDPGWFQPIAPPESAPRRENPLPGPFFPSSSPPGRLPGVQPSAPEPWRMEARKLFDGRRPLACRHGSLVHGLLAHIDESADPAAFARWFDDRFPNPSPEEAGARGEILRCLGNPAVQAALTVPPAATLWRERPCDAIVDGRWISATFDRVHLGSDRATIVDFKTGDAARPGPDGPGSPHRDQLHLYRKALSRLTGIDEQAIDLHLIFTATATVIDVP